MPICMRMRWKNVTPEQYAAVRAEVDWVGKPPKGGVLHVATFEEGEFRAFDVWESAEAFNAFVEQRLMPAVAKVGVQGQPDVEIKPTHAVWIPELKKQM